MTLFTTDYLTSLHIVFHRYGVSRIGYGERAGLRQVLWVVAQWLIGLETCLYQFTDDS